MSQSRVTPISGFPEFLPGDRIVEQHFLDVIRETFELHGFASVETRAVEPIERLASQGEDADKEIYAISRLAAGPDDVGREGRLGLHFDLTVPFARYVLENAGRLQFPFRRYQIQRVWRGERPQEGRYREFTQADIDIVDVGSLPAHYEAELPLVIADAFSKLPVGPFRVQVNNRKIPEGFYLGLGLTDVKTVLRIVDKLDKIGPERVAALLVEAGATAEQAAACLALAEISSPDLGFVERVRALGVEHPTLDEGLDALAAVMRAAIEHAPGLLVADLRIARGLDYYTGTVYETQLVGQESYGSICSGGRYDALASDGRTTYPGVGISIGVSRLLGRLIGPEGLSASRSTPTCVLVALAAEDDRAQGMRVAAALRRRGIPVEVAPAAAKFGKQIRFAERRGIPFVWFPGAGESRRPGQGHPQRGPGRRRPGHLGAAGGRPATATSSSRRPSRRRGRSPSRRSDRRGLSRRRSQPAVAQLEQRQRADDVRVVRPPRSGGVVGDPRQPVHRLARQGAQREQVEVGVGVDEPLRGGGAPDEPQPQQQPEAGHQDDRDDRRDQPEHRREVAHRDAELVAGVPDRRTGAGGPLEGALQVLADQRDLAQGAAGVLHGRAEAAAGALQPLRRTEQLQGGVVDHAPAVRPQPHPRQHPDVGEDLGGAAAGRVGVHLHDRTLAPGLPGRDPDEDRVTAPPSWRQSTGAATGPHGRMDQLSRRTLIAVKVAIPREVKNHEYRVAITPSGVHELVRNGHEVYVETDAGVGSSILNEDYVAAGATILDTAEDVWGTGDMILKVKEPIASEYDRMREGQTLFTYLHLAADQAADPGAGQAQGHRHRLRDGRAAGPLAAAAGPDVRGRRPARPAGRCRHADARPGWPRGADGRCLRCLRRQGRRHRRRRRPA